MIIYLNPVVNGGAGRKKLSAIYDRLKKRAAGLGTGITVEDIPINPMHSILRHFEKGETSFIAGGGDGTVHSLANAMMALPENTRKAVTFGAIGLGSSNDFHKPMKDPNMIGGIPVKIDHTKAISHNVALAEYTMDTGKNVSEYFIINASMGAAAHVNNTFNTCGPFTKWLKPKWVTGAICCCAMRVFIRYKNFKATLNVNNDIHDTHVSNLGIVIYPYFAGNFKYDTEVSPQSDHLCVNLCENMNKFEQFISTCYLSNHVFLNRPKTKSWNAQDVSVSVPERTALEMDGEVRMVKDVKISLIKGGLNVCQ